MYPLVVPSLSTNFIKNIATRICQFSQYLGTMLVMLFEIAKSIQIIIISTSNYMDWSAITD